MIAAQSLNIEIRNEAPADAPAIEAVTISAFLNAPHSGHNEQFIVGALRKAGQLTVSLVAVAEANVIGRAVWFRTTRPFIRAINSYPGRRTARTFPLDPPPQ